METKLESYELAKTIIERLLALENAKLEMARGGAYVKPLKDLEICGFETLAGIIENSIAKSSVVVIDEEIKNQEENLYYLVQDCIFERAPAIDYTKKKSKGKGKNPKDL